MTENTALPVDGKTVVAAMIDDGLALMTGVGMAMPATIEIYLNGQNDARIQASVISWRQRDGGDHPYGFVALLPVDGIAQRRLKTAVFKLPGQSVEYRIDGRNLGVEAVLSAVAEQSGPAFATVIDGVIEALLAGKPGKKRLRTVAALLRIAARSNGFIEVLGGLEEGEIYIQGWSGNFPTGRTRVVAIGDQPVLAELTSAEFARDDLGENASGVTGLMNADHPINAAKLKRVYFRGRDGWHSIEVYHQRVMVAPQDVPAHIRSVLDRVRGPENILGEIRMAAHRFDGRDTVSELPRPVRIGIDFSLVIEGSGVLVSGWMLDPDRSVQQVSLRVGGAGVARIDDRWTRQSRADVTDAFRHDPMFAGLNPARNSHGFLVFCPLDETPSSDQPVYLELAIADAFPAYCPLHPGRASARQALSRVLPSLDPRSVTASSSIERQFGPMLQNMTSQRPYAIDTHDIGAFDADAPLALVVGFDDSITDVGVTIALLGLDDATRNLPIVLAGPAESFDQVGSDMIRLAAFYKLDARIVFAEGVEDYCDALEVGIAATNAETVALVSAHILPRDPGWFDRLHAAYRKRGGKCVICPTILFEDDSVRWAGTWIDGQADGRYLSDRYVGYPRAVLADAQPAEVSAGTPECCIMPRKAFEEVDGFTRGYIGPAEKGLDLALKLRMAGTPSWWIPEIEVLGCEQATVNGPAWQELSHRLDRWAFDRRWSLVVSNLRSHTNAVS